VKYFIKINLSQRQQDIILVRLTIPILDFWWKSLSGPSDTGRRPCWPSGVRV